MIEDAIEKGKHLLLVSNGSSKYIHMMFFGWVLATTSGTWLAESKGPGSGEDSSYKLKLMVCYQVRFVVALSQWNILYLFSKYIYIYIYIYVIMLILFKTVKIVLRTIPYFPICCFVLNLI